MANRRAFLKQLGLLTPSLWWEGTQANAQAPAVVTPDRLRPSSSFGVQAGDVTSGSAVIWSRTDRPAQMWVRYRTSPSAPEKRVKGPACLEQSDFTGRIQLSGLPPGQQLLYTVEFEDLSDPKRRSVPVEGSFRTTPRPGEDVRFLWSGDTVGQGWGINPEWGGLRIYETMRQRRPHFFLHSGDTIYADGPVTAEVKLPDGTIWKNIVTEEKSKPAETLAEFRGAYRYNLLDEKYRRFNSEVAQVWQWDDHEVMNNWSPGKDLSGDARYHEKNIRTLAARASKAFQEYAPIAPRFSESGRVYRKIPCGPLVDVFVLDMRTYRGPNTFNRQTAEGPETTYLGAEQRTWLKNELSRSKAVWKVIASDMPLGLIVDDGKDSSGRPRFENSANGNGEPLGRELEIADLLRHMKTHQVRNAVWFTADVHYTAAHHYHPDRAQFREFLPFWEFVSGPLHAGTFGPSALDDTFGIEVAYQKAPPKGQLNLPPSAGLQFFGEVEVNAKTRVMTVTLRDVAGAALYTKELTPT